MRSRSGAIHSDTAEDFLIMAELSQSKNGIFYDESTNKKIMNQIQKTHKHRNKAKIPSPKSKEPDQISQNVFKHFNFNKLSEQGSDQLQELDKKVSHISKVICLGIESSNFGNLKQKILSQIGLQVDLVEQDRYLDLVVVQRQQLMFKIWMVREKSTQKYSFLHTYFDTCHMRYKQVSGKYLLQSVKDQHYQKLTQIHLPFLTQ